MVHITGHTAPAWKERLVQRSPAAKRVFGQRTCRLPRGTAASGLNPARDRRRAAVHAMLMLEIEEGEIGRSRPLA